MRFATRAGIALATALGAGFSPWAPGTCGTAVAVLLFWLMSGLSLWAYLLALLLIIGVGTWAAGVTGREYREVDHQRIVIDEVAGYLVTMIAAPLLWTDLITGFALFRLFDIFKPFPVGWVDRRMKNPFGVMLDDLLAGLYAMGSLTLFRWLWPAIF